MVQDPLKTISRSVLVPVETCQYHLLPRIFTFSPINGVLFLGGCGPAMSCVTLGVFTVLRVSTIPKFPPLYLPSCQSLTPFWHQFSTSLPFLASTFQPSNFLALFLFLSFYFRIHPLPLLFLTFFFFFLIYLYFSLLFFFDLLFFQPQRQEGRARCNFH